MRKPVTPEELDGFVESAIHAPNLVADVMVLRVADTLRDEWELSAALQERWTTTSDKLMELKADMADLRAEHKVFLDNPDALEKAHTAAVRRQEARQAAEPKKTAKAAPAPPVAVAGAFRA